MTIMFSVAAARKLFYGLSAWLLLVALFVMGGVGEVRERREVGEVRQEIKNRLAVGWQQVWSDQSVWDGLELAWDGVTGFYDSAADELLALLEPTKAEDDMNRVLAAAWQRAMPSKGAVAGEVTPVENFMTDEPLLNIIP